MKIFLICPVRGISESERSAIAAYVAGLEEEHTVYWPLRDTPQDGPTGVEICLRNRLGLSDCDEVWVWWNPESQGSKFDLGMAWALHKPLRVIRQCVTLAGAWRWIMTIRICLKCKRFTAFKLCPVCGKETEEWKDGTQRLAGEATESIEAVKSAQTNTGVEAPSGQEEEKGPRKAQADQGTEG